MKSHLEALFQKVLHDLDYPSDILHVTRPENSSFGEYTTNVAFLLGKTLKQNPIAIAQKIIDHVDELKKKQEDIKDFTILQDISAVSIAGPGFINLTVANKKFINQLQQVLIDKEAYGTRKNSKTPSLRTIVEYTDPNPFKELHVGHLYSNTVGESLARLYESQGNDVRRVNYQGDVGLHVAKALWGMMRTISENEHFEGLGQQMLEKSIAEIGTRSLEDRAKWLGQAYVTGAMAYEDNPEVQEEVKVINIYAFMAAQRMHEEAGVKPIINYTKLLPEMPLNAAVFNPETMFLLYTTGRAWSLEYFETQYKKLGTTFKEYYFESMVAELGYQIVLSHIDDGIFEKSDGAIIYKGEKHGLHTRVFINKLGLPTYEAKELGLAPKKYEDWPYDRSIIVTGKEIDEYFKVLLSALKEVKPDLAQKTIHISHGMIRLPEGKMSSRTGKILTAEWLMGEVNASISSLIDKSESKFTPEERNEIVERATVAAIKYSLLKVSLPSDIAFDLDHSVSFEGDSGPYLLYTYARCKSVLRKARELFPDNDNPQLTTHNPQLNSEEHALARLILYFPEIVEESAENLSPSTVARYLIDVAQSFNLFYAKHKIIELRDSGFEVREHDDEVREHVDEMRDSGFEIRENSNRKSETINSETRDSNLETRDDNLGPRTSNIRLLLTEATAQVLKNGLALLGISTVEQM